MSLLMCINLKVTQIINMGGGEDNGKRILEQNSKVPQADTPKIKRLS
jgi:hypothetical protein